MQSLVCNLFRSSAQKESGRGIKQCLLGAVTLQAYKKKILNHFMIIVVKIIIIITATSCRCICSGGDFCNVCKLIKDTHFNESHRMPTASRKYIAIIDDKIVYLLIIYGGVFQDLLKMRCPGCAELYLGHCANSEIFCFENKSASNKSKLFQGKE